MWLIRSDWWWSQRQESSTSRYWTHSSLFMLNFFTFHTIKKWKVFVLFLRQRDLRPAVNGEKSCLLTAVRRCRGSPVTASCGQWQKGAQSVESPVFGCSRACPGWLNCSSGDKHHYKTGRSRWKAQRLKTDLKHTLHMKSDDKKLTRPIVLGVWYLIIRDGQ